MSNIEPTTGNVVALLRAHEERYQDLLLRLEETTRERDLLANQLDYILKSTGIRTADSGTGSKK
jgi:hypothetical protein